MNNTLLLQAGRAALLDLLADLLLRELDAETAAVLASDPLLLSALAPPSDEADLRALRSDYARLFLVEVPPYGSIYREAPPVIGGDASRQWEHALAARGRPLASLERAAAADHAGLGLRALAAAERANDAPPVLAELLYWLPQFLTALQHADATGFYGRVAAVAASAVRETAGATPADVVPAAYEEPPPPQDTSLREIADWLCTPVWSGIFLSKQRLRALAAPFGVPLALRERATMLRDLFEASAFDGRTAELLDALDAEAACWDGAVADWRTALAGWAQLLEPWAAGLRHTHDVIRSMRAALDVTPGSA